MVRRHAPNHQQTVVALHIPLLIGEVNGFLEHCDMDRQKLLQFGVARRPRQPKYDIKAGCPVRVVFAKACLAYVWK